MFIQRDLSVMAIEFKIVPRKVNSLFLLTAIVNQIMKFAIIKTELAQTGFTMAKLKLQVKMVIIIIVVDFSLQHQRLLAVLDYSERVIMECFQTFIAASK